LINPFFKTVGGKKSIIMKYSGNKKPRISVGLFGEKGDVHPQVDGYQILRFSIKKKDLEL